MGLNSVVAADRMGPNLQGRIGAGTFSTSVASAGPILIAVSSVNVACVAAIPRTFASSSKVRDTVARSRNSENDCLF